MTTNPTERRVVLRGALAASAALATGTNTIGWEPAELDCGVAVAEPAEGE